MTKKELIKISINRKKIENIKRIVLKLKEESKSPPKQDFTRIPIKSSNLDCEYKINKAIYLENILKQLEQDNLTLCANFIEATKELTDVRQISILQMRYLKGCTWSRIEKEIHISRSTAIRLHQKALKTLIDIGKLEE